MDYCFPFFTLLFVHGHTVHTYVSLCKRTIKGGVRRNFRGGQKWYLLIGNDISFWVNNLPATFAFSASSGRQPCWVNQKFWRHFLSQPAHKSGRAGSTIIICNVLIPNQLRKTAVLGQKSSCNVFIPYQHMYVDSLLGH